ncbi:MAG TPA: hypothetical protein VNZ86_10160 [Bacteroidia bacterium]|jgi:hypothetical protein|nr:hypothetical protein [Bacteroidia bacterium]
MLNKHQHRYTYMKQQTKHTSDSLQSTTSALITYAYLQEMKEDASAFEKRKVKSASFSPDHTQLIITGSGKGENTYTILLKSIRKVYSRTDREYDKVIVRGFISMGEDYSVSERQILTIYLKGHPAHHHVAQKIKNTLLALARKVGATL